MGPRFAVTLLTCLALACGKSSKTEPRASASGAGGSAAGSSGSDGQAAASGSETGGGDDGGSGGGSGGSVTSGGTGGADAEASAVSLDGAPIYTRVQRLTNSQWAHAVADILHLGAPIGPDILDTFPSPVSGTSDFTNNERVLFVDSGMVDAYQTAAEAVAQRATGSEAALAALDAGEDAPTFVQRLGRRAFRRPPTADEETKYQAIFTLGQTLYGETFANGAALVVRAMLESPHFLYRTELGPAGDPLSGYEVASKLSFWLLGTTPSDALLDRAAEGALDSDEGLEATAREMLEMPAALEVMRDFHGQLLHLERLRSVGKTGVPEYSDALNPELTEAAYLFFDRVFGGGFGLREIYTATQGFAGPGLAPLYGLEAPASGLELYELGPSRAGFFQQIPFLLLNGINRTPDPIHRGLALHLDMLCAALEPPGDVQPPPVPPEADGQTNRELIEALTADCGGTCHVTFIDPLGFAFESFDGMGQERTVDNGRPVDTHGSYPFAEGTRDFSGAGELMQLMAESEQAHVCYAKKVSGYALGRDLVEADRPLLEALGRVSGTRSVKEVMIALVRDPAFRLRREGTP